jgi:hypothetical protein
LKNKLLTKVFGIWCVELPSDFPEKYEKTIRKAVDNCLVARLGKRLNENSFASSVSRADG